MTIEEYYEACKKIAEEGRIELEIEDKNGSRKKMVATEYLKRLKQFGFEDKSITPVSFRNALILKEDR